MKGRELCSKLTILLFLPTMLKSILHEPRKANAKNKFQDYTLIKPITCTKTWGCRAPGTESQVSAAHCRHCFQMLQGHSTKASLPFPFSLTFFFSIHIG